MSKFKFLRVDGQIYEHLAQDLAKNGVAAPLVTQMPGYQDGSVAACPTFVAVKERVGEKTYLVIHGSMTLETISGIFELKSDDKSNTIENVSTREIAHEFAESQYWMSMIHYMMVNSMSLLTGKEHEKMNDLMADVLSGNKKKKGKAIEEIVELASKKARKAHSK